MDVLSNFKTEEDETTGTLGRNMILATSDIYKNT